MTIAQRERLRSLADERETSMAETLDAALESLRRETFYRTMSDAEDGLRADPDRWSNYVAERDAWLDADIART